MKFKVTTFRFTKEIEGTALFPADASEEYIERVLANTALDLDDWNAADWESHHFGTRVEDIPATECVAKTRNKYLYPSTAMVVELNEKVLVNPEDVTWWHATDEEAAEEVVSETPSPDQILLFRK